MLRTIIVAHRKYVLFGTLSALLNSRGFQRKNRIDGTKSGHAMSQPRAMTENAGINVRNGAGRRVVVRP
jgi:hypothetical protein